MTGWFFTLLMAAGPANALRPQRLEDGDIVGDGGAAHVEDAAESGILHLHVAGLTGKLHRAQHVHGDAGGADRLALGLEAAGGVDRDRKSVGEGKSVSVRGELGGGGVITKKTNKNSRRT